MTGHEVSEEKKVPRRFPWSGCLLFALVMIPVSEFGLTLFEFVKANLFPATGLFKQNISEKQKTVERYGIDIKVFQADLAYLHDQKIKYHPFRWYALPENASGTYFRTDAFGFRNDRTGITSQTAKIGFFGGSTMFSTSTRQGTAIPDVMNRLFVPNVARALNYGIGGYSSTNELMTLIEVVRQDKLAFAIFYDGVNEFSRFIEMVQDDNKDPWFQVMGYPYQYIAQRALETTLPQIDFGLFSIPANYEPKLLHVAHYLYKRIKPPWWKKQPSRDFRDETQIPALASQISDIYVSNVKAIQGIAQANQVKTVFFLQPNLHTIKGKKFTPYEESLRTGPEKRLAEESYRCIRAHPDLKGFPFFDISDALDGLDERNHLIDYCHTTPEGNQAVAERMAKILREFFPAEYWQP